MPARRLILFLILAALAAFGQGSKSVPGKAPPGDAEMERAIRERFARSKCAADHFTVRVQGGVATIEGKTDVIQRKGSATRMAKAAGARKVVNKIEVSEAARQKASSRLVKGRRRVQVRRGDPRR